MYGQLTRCKAMVAANSAQHMNVNGTRSNESAAQSMHKGTSPASAQVSPKAVNRQPFEVDNSEESVTIRPSRDGDTTTRDVCISCNDATGLGCDVARMLLDFGLIIVSGDWHTDGEWCFIMIVVRLAPRMPAHWKLLKTRLLELCPKHLWINSWRPPNPADVLVPFLLQVSSYDRAGVLHDLMHTLWEADVTVFKAYITTSPSHDVLDKFWLYDNRFQLPDHHRVLEISDQVRQVMNEPAAGCSITAAPPDSASAERTSSNANGTAVSLPAASVVSNMRRPCKDANATSPLARLGRKGGGGNTSATSSVSSLAALLEEAGDQWGSHDRCEVTLDNATTDAYTCVHVLCPDRKGLVYDLMRTIKDLHLRVAFARVAVQTDGLCDTDLFVQHVNGGHISDRDDQEVLHARVLAAVAIPVRIAIRDIHERTVTEIVVTAQIDSGGKGRPRVTYDVTEALNAAKLCVFKAEMYIEAEPEAAAADRRPQELHRFLVNGRDGSRLTSSEQKKDLYQVIQLQLAGIAVESRNQQPSGGHRAPTTGTTSATASAAANQRSQRPAAAKVGRDIIDSLANWSWSS